MQNENLLKMAQFILKLRKEKKLTQKDLAEQLGVTDKAVSKWERGLSYPDISLLSKLSIILGVTTNELLHGEKADSLKPGEGIVENTRQNAAPTIKGKTDRIKKWKFIGMVSIIFAVCILVLIGCNFAIDSGLRWALFPFSMTFYIGLAIILGAFIMGKNKISAVLLSVFSVYLTTYFYSALNTSPPEVINSFSGFPKVYIPHYTIILGLFLVSLILAMISLFKKSLSGAKVFHLAAISITVILLSTLTVPSIMDYVDINSLGVDGRFSILLFLSVVINSIVLTIFARRYIRQMETSQ